MLEPATAGVGRVLVAFALIAWACTTAAAFDEAEYEKAARMILCDCGCHPQSAHECACGRAAEMRREIAGLIEQGKSGDDVVALYVQQHGEKIRIAPTARGFNLVAWLGPLVGLLLASLTLVLLVRRWSSRQPQPEPAAAIQPPPPGDAYQARLRQELEEW